MEIDDEKSDRDLLIDLKYQVQRLNDEQKRHNLILVGDGNGNKGMVHRTAIMEQTLLFTVRTIGALGMLAVTTIAGLLWMIFTGQVSLSFN